MLTKVDNRFWLDLSKIRAFCKTIEGFSILLHGIDKALVIDDEAAEIVEKKLEEYYSCRANVPKE